MSDQVIIFQDFQLIDLEKGEIQSGVSLVVEKGRVRDLTRQPGSGRRVSLGGGFILPGLIDAHVHLVWEGQPDPNRYTVSESIPSTAYRAARSAWRNLQGGVTTVRDVGGPHGITIALAQAVADGRIAGSRILAAGSPVAQTGGHVFTMAREADGIGEVCKAVREQIKTGADFIKLMCSGGAYTKGESIHATQLTPAEIRAAVDEAHAAERRVAAHALPERAIQNCLEAGVDTIEHGALLTAKNVETFRQSGAFLVPTLAPYHIMASQGAQRGVPEYAVEKSKTVMNHYLASLKTASGSGVNLALGTDGGSPTLPHPTLPWEAWLWYREAGLDALTVLRAATIGSARALGREQELGLLKPGYWADLVVYARNPLEDLSVLHEPQRVFQGGREIADIMPVWSSILM